MIQEHSDDRVVYQIPASDLKFAEKLGASLEGVLSEDDHELVTAAFDGSFKNLGKPREISLDLLEHHNPELIKYTVEVSEIAGGKNRWVRHKITGNYPRNSPIEFDRWSHLFEVE